jgi:hypothetical protein
MTDPIATAVDELLASTRSLREQLENPRAHAHHRAEALQAVETDARWIAHVAGRR